MSKDTDQILKDALNDIKLAAAHSKLAEDLYNKAANSIELILGQVPAKTKKCLTNAQLATLRAKQMETIKKRKYEV